MSEQGTRRAGGTREVPSECARLAATLRELRAGTGLSLAALATKTHYSKSSWERYLNGRSLPPRQAVEQLCALAGAELGRPLALWELAEVAWSGRAGGTGRTETPEGAAPGREPAPAEPAKPRFRIPWLYAGILGALSLLAAGTLIVMSRPGTGPAGDNTTATDLSAPGPGCHAASCTGKDPEDLECSTAAEPPASLREQRLDGTMVKVRHSAVCQTVWARIDRGTVGDRVEIVVPGSDVQQSRVKDKFDARGSVSSPMVPAHDDELGRVKACLVRQGERHCYTAVMPQ
ncbi:helix-turn-helix domain-containing protein [Streptomyces canus]|uniref:helix-turn-helix domain-containing protein n=1 Tax=Streptomyces canus TaxID=58343 RepID=UPI0030E1AF41